ncbi:MAG: DUF6428 family protein [Bacteroidota bacterium]
MTLSQLKSHLDTIHNLSIFLADGSQVPAHFHLTEIGEVSKQFVDCGGTLRVEKAVSLQLWTANDYDHRLSAEKLRNIIEMGERTLGLGDWNVEVEYQGDRTIERYQLDLVGGQLQLTGKHTDCLAKGSCDLPETNNERFSLDAMIAPASACAPSSGCC